MREKYARVVTGSFALLLKEPLRLLFILSWMSQEYKETKTL
jgi:hypothetical protein